MANMTRFLLCKYFHRGPFIFRMLVSAISDSGAWIAMTTESHRCEPALSCPSSANPLHPTSTHGQGSSLLLLAVTAGKQSCEVILPVQRCGGRSQGSEGRWGGPSAGLPALLANRRV